MKITFIVPGFPICGGVKRIMYYANVLYDLGHDIEVVSHAMGHPFWFQLKPPVIISPDLSLLPDADALIGYECMPPFISAAYETASESKGRKFMLVLSAGREFKLDFVSKNVTMPNVTKICSTEYIRDWCDLLGVKDSTARELLLAGIDGDQFQRVSVFKEWPGITVGAFVSDRSEEYTGLGDLFEAWRIAKQSIPEMHLITYSRSRSHPPESSRHWISPDQDYLKGIYSMCDVWLCANRSDGLGMPPLEAMACGCALVTTDTKGNRFYARHGETALVSPPGDPKRLAGNLILMAKDNSMRERISHSGMQFARSLRWEDSADRLSRIIQQRCCKPSIGLSVICTSYNRCGMTIAWMDSVRQWWPGSGFELIVVDDGSTDGSRDAIKSFAQVLKERGIDIITVLKDHNSGFAESVACAQDKCRGEFVLVTQNDVSFLPGSIEALVRTFKWLENELGDCGVISISGGMMRVDVAAKRIVLDDYSHWNGDGVEGYGRVIDFDWKRVDYVNGFLMLYRRTLSEKGVRFDPRYRLYWEDIDFCRQVQELGLSCYMVGMSHNKIPRIHHERNRTIRVLVPEWQKINSEMEYIFGRKWYGW